MPAGAGEVIDGRFHVVGKIGEGSHGEVWRARDAQSGDDVAVKVLGAAAQDPEYSVRLVREAKAMAALAGTSAVKVIASGTDDDGAFYIAMELLHGETLADRIDDVEDKGGRLSSVEVVRLIGPIVDTLEMAHDRGIVHRDLKPANIFLVDDAHGGGVKLLDFGLVKLMKGKALTRAGMVAGSPNYIAPEAWRGEPDKLDHRIDVFSLGAVLYRCLAGEPPFPGEDLREKLVKITRGPRPSLRARRPELPALVDEWVELALAVDPEERFQRVREMFIALRNILGLGADLP